MAVRKCSLYNHKISVSNSRKYRTSKRVLPWKIETNMLICGQGCSLECFQCVRVFLLLLFLFPMFLFGLVGGGGINYATLYSYAQSRTRTSAHFTQKIISDFSCSFCTNKRFNPSHKETRRIMSGKEIFSGRV